MTGRICRQRQHCDNLHFPLVLWPQCVHLNVHLFDNGQRKETRGECISQLCNWALYLLTMYLSIIPCKHVGVCSAVYILPLCGCCPPGCISQSRLPDVTGRLDIMLKRTKMYSWVVAQEAQFYCVLSKPCQREIELVNTWTNCWIWCSLLVFGSQTEHCGWGAQAAEFIRKGDFVIEYTGEGM
jgi:hypothetical protein